MSKGKELEKVVFDCINDELSLYRPYGKKGIPMPWSKQMRLLRGGEVLEFDKMFDLIKGEIHKERSFEVGALPRKGFQDENEVFMEEAFQEEREK